MALGRPAARRRETTEVVTVQAEPGALVAAASPVKLDTASLRQVRIRDEEWQRESWRHLDICGELRTVASRHANAVSRCSIFVADIGEDGKPGAETSNAELKALSQSLFGGPLGRAKGMRQIGMNNFVAGECYLVAESRDNEEADLWYVVSTSEIKKQVGKIKVKRPDDKGGGWLDLRDGKDLLIRIWTQHPRMSSVADSSVRSALPVLREIERLTMLTFSLIDSRLISAGLLLLPQGIDFPHEAGKPGGVQGLLDMLLQAAQAQLKGAGTAAGLVPLMAEIPADAANAVKHIQFETAVVADLKDKLDHAIRRLSLSLDCEPEDLLGHGDVNHWSGWLIDESTIKLYIEPVVQTICEALTVAILKPYLEKKGLDPAKFIFWYDSSALTVRPNRFEDAKALGDEGIVSQKAVRAAGNFDEDDAPDEEELKVFRVWELVKAQPQLLSSPEIADILGLPVVQMPGPALPPGGADLFGPDGGQPDQGGDLQVIGARGAPNGGNPPDNTGDTLTEAKQAKRGQPSLTASVSPGRFAAMLPGAELIVLRALELAGGRLVDHHKRRALGDVPRELLHTRQPAADVDHARALLASAFTHVPALARHHDVDPSALEYLLTGYCAELLAHGHPHDPELLAAVLDRADRQRIPA